MATPPAAWALAAVRLQDATRAARPAVSCGSGATVAAGMQGRESSAGRAHGAKALLMLAPLFDAIDRPFSRQSAARRADVRRSSWSPIEIAQNMSASNRLATWERVLAYVLVCAPVTEQMAVEQAHVA